MSVLDLSNNKLDPGVFPIGNADVLAKFEASTKKLNKQSIRSYLSRQTDSPINFALQAVEKSFNSYHNDYELFKYIGESDANIFATLSIKASLVANAFKGVSMNANGELDSRELYVLEYARKFEQNHLKFKEKAFSSAFNLLRDGNNIYYKIIKSDGYPDLQNWPVRFVSILEHPGQLYSHGLSPELQVWSPNYYVLNEDQNLQVTHNGKPLIRKRNRMIHMQTNRGHSEMIDRYGRFTFGIWSPSPLNACKQTWYWKQDIMWSHMLAREQSVPRLHHSINLEWINTEDVTKPEGFSGTIEEWVLELHQKYIDAYDNRLQNMSPDSPFITSQLVDIKVIEPKSTTYNDPNSIIQQLDMIHNLALGIPISISNDAAGSYASDVIRSSYSSVTTERLIGIIYTPLLEWMKEVLLMKLPGFRKQINQLDFNLQLTLDKDHAEMMRLTAIADSTKLFHEDELRSMSGHPNTLSPKQKKEREAFYRAKEKERLQPGQKPGEQGSPAAEAANNKRRSSGKLQRPATSSSKNQQQAT